MTMWADPGLDGAPGAPGFPPLRAYGLAPGPEGYRLADLRCAPGRDAWRAEGLYTESAVALVLSGVFEFASEGRTGTAIPGAFVFANKGEEFSCRHLHADGNRRTVIFFSSDFLEAVADELSLTKARFPSGAAPPSPLSPIVSGFMHRIAHGSGDSDEAALAIAEHGLRAGQAASKPDAVCAGERRRIVEVVGYINANFAGPCTLDVLAGIAGMNRFRFARRFRAVTGETANQYVLHRRLAAAAVLLLGTSAPVSQIAYDVGFNDLSYFYARFKNAFGSAPGSWRQAQGR
jgi:AraC family transcriptional regulator